MLKRWIKPLYVCPLLKLWQFCPGARYFILVLGKIITGLPVKSLCFAWTLHKHLSGFMPLYKSFITVTAPEIRDKVTASPLKPNIQLFIFLTSDFTLFSSSCLCEIITLLIHLSPIMRDTFYSDAEPWWGCLSLRSVDSFLWSGYLTIYKNNTKRKI